MRVAIQPENIESNCYSKKWAQFLQERNVEVKWVDLNAMDALESLKDCDGLMWRWAHTPQYKIKAYRILRTIEYYLGIPIFPDYNTCWHYDEKITQKYIFSALGIPTPETWVFWERADAVDWANNTDYPKIFKLSSGAGSANVLKITSTKEALRIIDTMFYKGIFPQTFNEHKKNKLPFKNIEEIKGMLFRLKHAIFYVLQDTYPPLPSFWWLPEKGYAYFQEFIPNNDYDTRLIVVGNRAFGCIRRNRQNDFRASGSGLVELEPGKINKKAIELAFNAAFKLKTQSLAFDILMKDGNPVIHEMSYTFPQYRPWRDFPGYWLPDLSWRKGNMWPEEAQVEDFIEYIKRYKAENKERF